MGRSKFPGKPSKHVNRTRINVLSTVINTTVVGDYNPNVVTVKEGDNSNKVDDQASSGSIATSDKENGEKRVVTRSRKKLLGISNKRSPVKRTVLLSNTSNAALNSTTRLTRSKVARRSVRGISNIRKINNPKLSKSPKKESSNVVGKFVLPSRSVHSSRVIKPNKRFINVEQSETRIVKKRIVNKKQCLKPEEKAGESAGVSAEDDSGKNEEVVEKKEVSGAKVVLRQARLQINPKTPVGPEGPFSSKLTSSPGAMKCGVCGAVRIYRNLKQARKFNIYSCECCRKFIMKMIQHSNDKILEAPLNCLKGQGMCPVDPILRSQQWRLNKITNNLRCSACWLKLCLRSFHLPLDLKANLSQFLPKNMQPSESLFKTTLPLLTWQSTIENKIRVNENKDLNLRQRPVRLKANKKEDKPHAPPVINDIKRQKMDMKGPRVKHVCRSASIVLGQPLAIFDRKSVDAQDKDKCLEQKVDSKSAQIRSDRDSVETKINNSSPEIKAVVTADVLLEEETVKAEIKEKMVKKDKNKNPTVTSMLPLVITKPYFNKKSKQMSPPVENLNYIDIDFWETYDPDEIVCSGFSIIAPEDFPMLAICFLCGSAGKDAFLYCCICCEPYHPYCLEQGPPNFVTPEQKYTWICPKCTTCSACGEADKQKINCQKCHKSYHPQCFNTKWRTDDRPTVCSNCLRCKSCGTDNITKFVGNLALCLLCFKLRNKGNFCPLCQCCYDDNDFDTKMMECGKCNKWVHSKCEGLSDEHYQILSILPESVEFVCCLCSRQMTPHWRKAVQSELRSCFNNILRLLSKNRIARDMLKLSPLKQCLPISKQLNSARRLEFLSNESVDSVEQGNSIDNDLEQVKAIFTNKIDFGDSFTSLVLNDSKVPISPSIVEIKNKLHCNEYFSLREFNEGMELALKSTSSVELFNIYRSILKNVFPWFDPNIKEDLNKSICDISQIEKNEEEKKYSYEVFDVHVSEKIDERMCHLCKGIGDGLSTKESRLLYCGQNDWVHANCALWSSEVYEEIDGSLQNVQTAIKRGRFIRCSHCKQKGASVGCCLKGCSETYHFPCAIKASCIFIADKTIYCRTHEVSTKLNVLTNPREFEIRRSVYIEVDSKKKLCEPDKVNVMVGSLSVINLGKIIPAFSDNPDAIIPIGYVCSKLFWSTTEPWKLIPYKITTAISNSQSQVYIDKNFTVDHTLPKHVVEKKLRDINLWQRDDKEKDLVEFEDYEEPQSTADILSPELTDAILQELPHDLLDGISVQDMLMGYEELMNLDFKTTEINCNDNLSLNMNNESKSEDLDESKNTRELKRSKSEVFMRIEDKIKPKNPQRSCSLTWLQVDNTLPPAIKKRKIAPPRDNMFMQLLQVDGACDSSSSDCESPTNEIENMWSLDNSEEPVTCGKCRCTYRTISSYKRHMESCDTMFTSESEPETETLVVSVNENPEPQLMTSYETYSSFQATQNQIQSTVLNTQTILSDATKLQENNGVYYNYQPAKPIMSSQPNMINMNDPTITDNNPQLLNQYCVNTQNMCVNQPNLISVNKGSITLNPSIISVDNTQVMNPMNGYDIQQQPVSLQSVPYAQDVSPIINLTHQNQAITIDAKMLAPTVLNSMVNLPQNQWVRPIIPQNKPRPRPRIVAKRPRVQGNTLVLPQSSPSVILQHIPSTNMLPFVDAFQQQPGQNVQYVATLAPQMNSSMSPQTQLVQLPENNYISLVNNVQPTMIIQQPRVDTGQLIVDSNGSMVWATQPVQQVQPVYYGFETIVQNTVMQSQQFLPTTMAGVLTTNSSYSATTQVFQTSKLEPVIDGSYVIVNPNQIVNQVPQVQTNITQNITPQPIHNNVQIQAKNTNWNPTTQSQQSQQVHQMKPVQVVATTANNTTTNSITLPIAPFVPEQGIPTNIVTPTPKPPTSNQYRPMSRVLPMQTTAPHQKKHEKVIVNKEVSSDNEIKKVITNVEQHKIRILGDVIVKQCSEPAVNPCNDAAVKQFNEIKKPLNDIPVMKKSNEPIITKQCNNDIISTKKTNDLITKNLVVSAQCDELLLAKQCNDLVIARQCNDLVKQCSELVTKQCTNLKANQDDSVLKQCNDIIIKQCNERIIKQCNKSLQKSTDLHAKPVTDMLAKENAFDKLCSEGIAKPINDFINKPRTELLIKPSIDLLVKSSTDLIIKPSTDLLVKPNTDLSKKSNTNFLRKTSTDLLKKSSTNLIKKSSTDLTKKSSTDLVEKPGILLLNKLSDTHAHLATELLFKQYSERCNEVDKEFKEEKIEVAIKLPVPIQEPQQAAKETKLLKDKIEIKEQKVELKKPLEKEMIKVNKLQIAQLKPIKPKSMPSLADKENANGVDMKPVEGTLEEPFKPVLKVNKRPNQNTTIFYKIESSDGYDFTAASLPQIWRKVYNDVQAARIAHNLPPLPDITLRTINDLDLLGLKTKGMKYLLEQLPEAVKCKTYKPVFHKPTGKVFEEEDEDDGCKRCLPFDTKKQKYDMFGWLSSKHRTLEVHNLDAVMKRSVSSSLPMAMRFRTLKDTSKYSVGVYRSEIHGRGLFSLRDIESGEMVIEYAGEVIRSILTDIREKNYNKKGIGCYMFRIDDNLVVDATMRGNAARFINHSCDPNCYSKVVEILGCKHIIIFAYRKIICGEELTYDYKFPFEEDKIPCTCGTKRCRKFLN